MNAPQVHIFYVLRFYVMFFHSYECKVVGWLYTGFQVAGAYFICMMTIDRAIAIKVGSMLLTFLYFQYGMFTR